MDKSRIHPGLPGSLFLETEKKVINTLANLPNPWAIVHNVLLPAKYRNNTPDETDIILIGPPGVYSLEAKWWQGEIIGAWQDPWVYRTGRSGLPTEAWHNPIKTANDKKNILYSVLRESLPRDRFPVMGSVIFPPDSICQLHISPPPFTIEMPLLYLNDAVNFFKEAEARMHRRLHGRGLAGLTTPAIDRILGVITGRPTRPVETEIIAGPWTLTQPLPAQQTEQYLPYLAYNTLVPSQMALVKKLKLDEYLPQHEYQALQTRLLRESQVLFTLRGHPNVIQLYGPFTHADQLYVAYELVSGPSLADVIRSKDYSSEQVLKKVMLRVIEAIRAAHKNNIIHRSLSPSSIIILPNWNVKIADFALARFFQEATAQSQHMTGLDATPYTAPEVTRGEADKTSDIYAIGAICYELITGQAPEQIFKRAQKGDSLSFETDRPPVSVAVQKVVQKALALARGNRYHTIEEISRALRDALK